MDENNTDWYILKTGLLKRATNSRCELRLYQSSDGHVIFNGAITDRHNHQRFFQVDASELRHADTPIPVNDAFYKSPEIFRFLTLDNTAMYQFLMSGCQLDADISNKLIPSLYARVSGEVLSLRDHARFLLALIVSRLAQCLLFQRGEALLFFVSLYAAVQYLRLVYVMISPNNNPFLSNSYQRLHQCFEVGDIRSLDVTRQDGPMMPNLLKAILPYEWITTLSTLIVYCLDLGYYGRFLIISVLMIMHAWHHGHRLRQHVGGRIIVSNAQLGISLAGLCHLFRRAHAYERSARHQGSVFPSIFNKTLALSPSVAIVTLSYKPSTHMLSTILPSYQGHSALFIETINVDRNGVDIEIVDFGYLLEEGGSDSSRGVQSLLSTVGMIVSDTARPGCVRLRSSNPIDQTDLQQLSCRSIVITSEQYAALRRQFQYLSPMDYQIRSFNCMLFCLNQLEAIGALPYDMRAYRDDFIPGRVIDYAAYDASISAQATVCKQVQFCL